jgi:hypothetical protein
VAELVPVARHFQKDGRPPPDEAPDLVQRTEAVPRAWTKTLAARCSALPTVQPPCDRSMLSCGGGGTEGGQRRTKAVSSSGEGATVDCARSSKAAFVCTTPPHEGSLAQADSALAKSSNTLHSREHSGRNPGTGPRKLQPSDPMNERASEHRLFHGKMIKPDQGRAGRTDGFDDAYVVLRCCWDSGHVGRRQRPHFV